MQTCATLPSMTDRIDIDDPRLGAHKMPVQLAIETMLDIISTGEELQAAIINDADRVEQERIRDVARAQFEAYLDLTAQAATAVRALKPD